MRKLGTVLCTVLVTAFIAPATAQTFRGESCEAQWTGLEKGGATVTVDIQNGAAPMGSFSIVGDGRGNSEVSADYTRTPFKKVIMNIYSRNVLVRSIPVNKGPAPYNIDVREQETIVGSTNIMKPEEDDNPWLYLWIANKVMDCVKIHHHSSSSTDADGNTTTTTETDWSWDCSGAQQGMVIQADGVSYRDVSKIQLVATEVGGKRYDDNTNIFSFGARGGAKIQSLR